MGKRKREIAGEVDFLANCVKEIKGTNFLHDIPKFKVLKTSVPSLNRALGPLCGFPLSRMACIHGPNAAGKSALALILAKDFQQQGHMVAYVDAEHTLEQEWPVALGVDIEKLLVIRPDTLEDCAIKVDKVFNKYASMPADWQENNWLCVIVDTLKKLIPEESVIGKKCEKGIDRDMKIKEERMANQARLISQWLDKLTPFIGKHNVAFIVLQQEVVNIGASLYEPKWKLAGGNSLQFDNSLRIRVTWSGNIKQGDDNKVRLGKEHQMVVMKSKIGVDNEVAYFYTCTGRGEDEPKAGYDAARTIVREAKIQGIITNSGSAHFCKLLGEDQKWDGEKRLRTWLNENPEAMQKIAEEIEKYWEKSATNSCYTQEDDGKDIGPDELPPDLVEDETGKLNEKKKVKKDEAEEEKAI